MKKHPTPFKVGDWIIIMKEYRKKSRKPVKVVSIDNEQVLIALWGEGEGSINPFYFELATEKEIKIHKIKNMF
jgi:hypothetical protein